MRGFLIGTIATAVAFALMTYLLPNVDYAGEIPGLIVLALIAGVVNGLIKPIVRLLALPVRMATLGLVSFVINAAMLLLIAWLAGLIGIDFTIAGFPPDFSVDAILWAVVGAVVLSIISTVIGIFIHD
ncbi:MAG TPA: phage holin family protein [Candidatus Limnocylindrales bacterium]|nr:phage holin family protein [Candidatus Limnocylindrales bacterium]